MSHIEFNQQFLEGIKREAKKKKREDPTVHYNGWLDILSGRHGFATYESLTQHVKELQQKARDQSMAAEEAVWVKRFESPQVWGSLSSDDRIGLNETLPLPVADGSICWPNCFAGSSLFTCADGPRRQIDGRLFTIDSPEMLYQGEELRVGDDETILMALISVAGEYPCGRLVEFSVEDLDKAAGTPLPEWGIPVPYDAIARTLWRLAHCELTVNQLTFKGPILLFADARKTPERFAIRFHPSFANFYYPALALFS